MALPCYYLDMIRYTVPTAPQDGQWQIIRNTVKGLPDTIAVRDTREAALEAAQLFTDYL